MCVFGLLIRLVSALRSRDGVLGPFSSGTASSATGESDTPSDSTTMGCGACSTTRGPSFATGRSSDTAETVYAVLAFLFGLVVGAALLKWESS